MKRSFLAITLSGLALLNLPVLAQQPEQAPIKSQPPASTETKPATDQADKPEAGNAITRGSAILQTARKAVGEAALKNLQDIVIKSQSKLSMLAGQAPVVTETVIKLPNKILNRTHSGFGAVLQAYNGQIAWHKTARGLEEYTSGSTLDEFHKALANETIFLLTQAEQPGFIAEFQKEVMIDNRPTNLIVIRPGFDHEISLYVDAENGNIVRKTYRSYAAKLKFEHEENYSDFREEAGLRLPFKRTRLRNGQPFLEMTITEIKVNTGVTDSSFDKPAK